MLPRRYYPYKCTPTVHPAEPFDAIADAAAMCKALKGRIDEETIIDLTTKRGIIQRLEIADIYKKHHVNTLIHELKSKLSGDFGNTTVALMTPLQDYYVKELHDAVKAKKIDERTIIEMLCTIGNYGVRTVTEAYEKLYEKRVEDDLKEDPSGQFKSFVIALCQANRDENETLDIAQAQMDAKELFEIGEKQWSDEESHFNTIIRSNSYQQLRQLFLEYEKISGDDIEVAAERAFSGSMKKGLLAFIKCTKSKVGFLTERLYEAMKGAGTKERVLTRVLVLRSEIDLGDIKETFEKRYGKSLEDWITKDTSGDYRKTLLSIISTKAEAVEV